MTLYTFHNKTTIFSKKYQEFIGTPISQYANIFREKYRFIMTNFYYKQKCYYLLLDSLTNKSYVSI